jgi:hypothetical protein
MLAILAFEKMKIIWEDACSRRTLRLDNCIEQSSTRLTGVTELRQINLLLFRILVKYRVS